MMDSPVRDEISKYMGMSDMGDALDFWERNTGNFPLLSAMARVYLALVACQWNSSSVPWPDT